MIKLGFIAENDISSWRCDCGSPPRPATRLEFNYWAGAKDLTIETSGAKGHPRHLWHRVLLAGPWGWNHTRPTRMSVPLLWRSSTVLRIRQGARRQAVHDGGGQISRRSGSNLAAFGQVFPAASPRCKPRACPWPCTLCTAPRSSTACGRTKSCGRSTPPSHEDRPRQPARRRHRVPALFSAAHAMFTRCTSKRPSRWATTPGVAAGRRHGRHHVGQDFRLPL